MPDVAAWYRSEDYSRIRAIMDDGHEMPASFAEWEKLANNTIAQEKVQGIHIKPVILDPDEFLAFCKDRKFPCGIIDRVLYAISKDQGLPGN